MWIVLVCVCVHVDSSGMCVFVRWYVCVCALVCVCVYVDSAGMCVCACG